MTRFSAVTAAIRNTDVRVKACLHAAEQQQLAEPACIAFSTTTAAHAALLGPCLRKDVQDLHALFTEGRHSQQAISHALSAYDAQGLTLMARIISAVHPRNAEVVSLLLSRGAGLKHLQYVDRDGCTSYVLNLAAKTAQHAVLEHLLSGTADSDSQERFEAIQSAAYAAILAMDLCSTEMLLSAGADPRVIMDSGGTLLHAAIVHNPRENVSHEMCERMWQLLLEHGAGIDAPGLGGITPMSLVTQLALPHAVRWLIAQGASLQSDGPGKNLAPLEHAVMVTSDVPVGRWPQCDIETWHKQRLEVVQLLLAAGACPNTCGLSGDTPVHVACTKQLPDVLQVLLAHGGNANVRNEASMVPLSYALTRTCVRCVELLLLAGADPEASWSAGKTTPLLAAATMTNYGATDDQRCQVAQLLVAHGADLNAPRRRGLTILQYACLSTDVAFTRHLLSIGADPNFVLEGKNCPSPLFLASSCQQAAAALDEEVASGADMLADRVCTVEMLIAAGADVRFQEPKHQDTPLHMACEHSVEVAQLLLAHGAPPAGRNVGGLTPLHIVCSSSQQPDMWRMIEPLVQAAGGMAAFSSSKRQQRHGWPTPLYLACQYLQLACVQELLRLGARVDEVCMDTNATPLFAACAVVKSSSNDEADEQQQQQQKQKMAQVAIVRLLILHGADVNALSKLSCTRMQTDRLGTPLLLAIHAGSAALVSELLCAGAKRLQPAQPGASITALQLAAYAGHADVLAVLLKHKRYQRELHPAAGTPPLHHACNTGKEECVRVLLEAGADPRVTYQGQTPLQLTLERLNSLTASRSNAAGSVVSTPMHQSLRSIAKLLLEAARAGSSTGLRAAAPSAGTTTAAVAAADRTACGGGAHSGSTAFTAGSLKDTSASAAAHSTGCEALLPMRPDSVTASGCSSQPSFLGAGSSRSGVGSGSGSGVRIGSGDGDLKSSSPLATIQAAASILSSSCGITQPMDQGASSEDEEAQPSSVPQPQKVCSHCCRWAAGQDRCLSKARHLMVRAVAALLTLQQQCQQQRQHPLSCDAALAAAVCATAALSASMLHGGVVTGVSASS